MKQIILVKYGEIILKGLNRHTFEDLLIRNIKNLFIICDLLLQHNKLYRNFNIFNRISILRRLLEKNFQK